MNIFFASSAYYLYIVYAVHVWTNRRLRSICWGRHAVCTNTCWVPIWWVLVYSVHTVFCIYRMLRCNHDTSMCTVYPLLVYWTLHVDCPMHHLPTRWSMPSVRRNGKVFGRNWWVVWSHGCISCTSSCDASTRSSGNRDCNIRPCCCKSRTVLACGHRLCLRICMSLYQFSYACTRTSIHLPPVLST